MSTSIPNKISCRISGLPLKSCRDITNALHKESDPRIGGTSQAHTGTPGLDFADL